MWINKYYPFCADKDLPWYKQINVGNWNLSNLDPRPSSTGDILHTLPKTRVGVHRRDPEGKDTSPIYMTEHDMLQAVKRSAETRGPLFN